MTATRPAAIAHRPAARSAGDTIFALASGAGRAAVAVLRLSGPEAGAATSALAGPLPAPRTAALRTLRDPATGAALDRALILWFPCPASFTGEDCAELHLHGGRAVVAAVLAALARQPRCRLAEPGEFTRRAFLNGKMDLGAVEGLADLIDAETEGQRRQAFRQLEGALGTWARVQRDRLLDALAAAESALDFADEGDVAGDLDAEVRARVGVLLADLDAELLRSIAAERRREGFSVVIAGPPNAGKSTLLNALARRDVAIVSPIPGTTRDPIAVELDLAGQLAHVVDTAGLREPGDAIEREGIARTLRHAARADLVLWLHEAGAPCPPDPALVGVPIWCIAAKADLAGSPPPGRSLSALTGAGLAELVAALGEAAAAGAGAEDAVATHMRHRLALTSARDHLAAVVTPGDAPGLELVADGLRQAMLALEALTGRIPTEEVLGAIFGRVCIGK